MTRTRHIVLFLAFVFVGLAIGGAIRPSARQAAPAAAASPAVGVIGNASFEELEPNSKLPRGWKPSQRGAAFSVDAVAHSGRASVRVASSEGADAWWSTVVLVKPYAKYRLSGWIRTENVQKGAGRGALFNLHGIAGAETQAVTGTQDWTRVEVTFDSGGRDAVQINCLFGGWGRSTGAAWYDDLQLEELSVRALAPAVSIRAASRRAPMSKYIYGQFIEHLGRCIYGGIWAEMLEDRKFFHDVGAAESPWKTVGGAAVVSMTTVSPFVGTHTPQIALPGDGVPHGIEQGELALSAGKKYVGYVVLAGGTGVGPVQVALAWGTGHGDRQAVTVNAGGSGFTKYPIAFTSPVTTDTARLVVTAAGQGTLRVGTASLMPDDNVQGFRPDTLALLRELNSPVYRWPGGNFVSGYNWRDGIGDRDRRPPRKNPAWKGVEHNDVGIDEFMALCKLLGTEPYIAVNSGLGDVASAADEVEYVNGAAATPMGALRASNGNPAPYGCRFWSVGNEMYGDWQLGHMPLAKYQEKHNEFARAMRAKDKSITLVGVGDVGPWTEGMLTNCAENMGLISEHFYCQEAPGVMGHVAQIPFQIKRISEAHKKYRQAIPGLAARDIRIALDEWNYWYGPHVYGELGTQYFLKDALGIVAGLHEFSRQSDIVFMANYAQTVNVIGAIKTDKRTAVLDTTGVVLALYRKQFGTVPVDIAGAPEPLDVAAAWQENGLALTLSVVNPTKQAQTIDLAVEGVKLPPTARLWVITGPDERSFNAPGKPPQVTVKETAAAPVGSTLTLPPMSASLYRLAVTSKAERPKAAHTR